MSAAQFPPPSPRRAASFGNLSPAQPAIPPPAAPGQVDWARGNDECTIFTQTEFKRRRLVSGLGFVVGIGLVANVVRLGGVDTEVDGAHPGTLLLALGLVAISVVMFSLRSTQSVEFSHDELIVRVVRRFLPDSERRMVRGTIKRIEESHYRSTGITNLTFVVHVRRHPRVTIHQSFYSHVDVSRIRERLVAFSPTGEVRLTVTRQLSVP